MKTSTFLAVLSLGLLTACAGTPELAQPKSLFRDELFKPASAAVRVDELFALSPAMRQYLDEQVAPRARRLGGRQGLLEALYKPELLRLEYDASQTRSASEAFEARRGNCLSLVLMTAAFAKALELPVRYQSVYVDEIWSRTEEFYVLSGHVNLSLGRRLIDGGPREFQAELVTIDFLPPEDVRGQRSRVIDERTVVAMYMNNRSAEELQQGRVDDAYWWAREAVNTDPHFTAAYNTLGVIYRRHGHLDLAEQVFRVVLAMEPANAQTMSNLVLVLKNLGRLSEAESVSARLRQIQPYPPFKFFDEGVLAMRTGDYQGAKRLFTQEVERFAYFHELHFWLALANYGLGNMTEVRKHLVLARDNSPTVKDKQMYAAKLQGLRGSNRSMQ